MNPTIRMLTLSSQDGRALYALLDAVEQDGLMRDDKHLKRWRELQVRVEKSSYSEERVQLSELVKSMDRAGHLEDTWMKAHWGSIQAEALCLSVEPRRKGEDQNVNGDQPRDLVNYGVRTGASQIASPWALGA